MKKTNWKQIDERLRTELETLLQAPTTAFHSDYKDALGWWILILVICIGGAAAALWSIFTSELIDMFAVMPTAAITSPSVLGLVATLALGAFVTFMALSQRGRRGYAALDSAIVVVRGNKLGVLPYGDIAETERHTAGARGERFTVLTVKLADGSSEQFSVAGSWAKEAEARLQRHHDQR